MWTRGFCRRWYSINILLLSRQLCVTPRLIMKAQLENSLFALWNIFPHSLFHDHIIINIPFLCFSVAVIGQDQPDQSCWTEIQLQAPPWNLKEVCLLIFILILKKKVSVFYFWIAFWLQWLLLEQNQLLVRSNYASLVWLQRRRAALFVFIESGRMQVRQYTDTITTANAQTLVNAFSLLDPCLNTESDLFMRQQFLTKTFKNYVFVKKGNRLPA